MPSLKYILLSWDVSMKKESSPDMQKSKMQCHRTEISSLKLMSLYLSFYSVPDVLKRSLKTFDSPFDF